MGFIRNLYDAVYNNLIAGGAYTAIIKGAVITLLLFFLAVLFGFAAGSLFTFLCLQRNKILSGLGAAAVFVCKATPVYLALLLWYYSFLGRMHRGSLFIAVLVLSFYAGGHMADILLRGVRDEAKRQSAAVNRRARKEFFQTLLPFITEQTLFEIKRLAQMLLQWTTLAGVIRVNDLTTIMTGIGQRTLYPFFSLFCAILFYLVLQLLIEGLFVRLKKRLEKGFRDVF